MFSFLLLGLNLISAPYAFEIDRGPSLEIKGGGSVSDSDDKNALSSGLRLSYAFSDKTDSFVTGELDFTFNRLLSKQIGLEQNKYLADANVIFYEHFNPGVFRLGGGFGAERRSLNAASGDQATRYRMTANIRGGLGWHLNEDLALFLDVNQHYFLNRNKLKMFDGFKLSQSLDLSLSVQTIF